MSEPLRKIVVQYRGMFVHAVAFEIVEIGSASLSPGQTWGYVVWGRESADQADDLIYGPAGDGNDYFTREAAEQAALHYGRCAIDIMVDLG